MGPLSRLIASAPADRAQFARDIEAIRPATHHYAILHVSRSGSTWLADLLSRQGDLGMPREYLNLDMVARFATEMNAGTLAEYFAMLRRKRATANGVFGLKAGWAQLQHLAEDGPLNSFLADYAWIYLRRRNAVAQAVSLFKARASRAYQRRVSDAPDVRRRLDEADAQVAYDAAAIGQRLDEIVASECAAERMLAAERISPQRLFYEDMMAAGPAAAVDAVHRLLFGADAPQRAPQASNIERSGTAQNREFEVRFHRERPDLVAGLEKRRPPLA